MIMIKNALTILFTAACLMSALPFYQTPASSAAQNKTQEPPPPRLTFSDLKRNDSIKGTFIVVGFVIQTYKCPPCPPGAMCKPCLGDHTVITDNLDEKDPALSRRLRIFTDKPEQFDLQKKYLFTVKIKGTVAPGHAIQDVDLISFEPIKEAQSKDEMVSKPF
jgi:hypothetical protein